MPKKISDKIKKIRQVKKLGEKKTEELTEEAENYRSLINQIEEEYQLASKVLPSLA